MLTYLRYALATFCFAASVGCLALWWRSTTHFTRLGGPTYLSEANYGFTVYGGTANFVIGRSKSIVPWMYESHPIKPESIARLLEQMKGKSFVVSKENGRIQWISFPLWYPALIFSLAGVASLRLSRFTLRSAIIATTVVAGLLGMAVIL